MPAAFGYSEIPDGYVFVPGDIDELVAALPADRLAEVKVRAGYGLIVPTDIAPGNSVAAPEDQTVDSLSNTADNAAIPAEDTTDPADSAPAKGSK